MRLRYLDKPSGLSSPGRAVLSCGDIAGVYSTPDAILAWRRNAEANARSQIGVNWFPGDHFIPSKFPIISHGLNGQAVSSRVFRAGELGFLKTQREGTWVPALNQSEIGVCDGLIWPE